MRFLWLSHIKDKTYNVCICLCGVLQDGRLSARLNSEFEKNFTLSMNFILRVIVLTVFFFFFFFAIGTDKVMYSSVFLLDNHIDLQILLLIL